MFILKELKKNSMLFFYGMFLSWQIEASVYSNFPYDRHRVSIISPFRASAILKLIFKIFLLL